MELQEFIETVISDICNAVSSSQNKLKDQNVIINPLKNGASHTFDKYVKVKDSLYCPIQNINFTVALESGQSQGKGSGLGVALGYFNIGTGTQKKEDNSAVTTVSFSIPIVLPYKA